MFLSVICYESIIMKENFIKVALLYIFFGIPVLMGAFILKTAEWLKGCVKDYIIDPDSKITELNQDSEITNPERFAKVKLIRSKFDTQSELGLLKKLKNPDSDDLTFLIANSQKVIDRLLSLFGNQYGIGPKDIDELKKQDSSKLLLHFFPIHLGTNVNILAPIIENIREDGTSIFFAPTGRFTINVRAKDQQTLDTLTFHNGRVTTVTYGSNAENSNISRLWINNMNPRIQTSGNLNAAGAVASQKTR